LQNKKFIRINNKLSRKIFTQDNIASTFSSYSNNNDYNIFTGLLKIFWSKESCNARLITSMKKLDFLPRHLRVR